jgi:signal transduction histidine kinase
MPPEAELYNQEPVELLIQLVKQLPGPAQLWLPDGTVVVTNPRFNELLGFPVHFDWASNKLQLRDDPQFLTSGVSQLLNRAFSGSPVEVHSVKYNPLENPVVQEYTGGVIQLVINLRPLFTSARELACILCLLSEVATGEMRYEQELMRSQKMESVETLASGVAHEFNNIFTGIKGMTDLIKGEVDQSSEIFEFADSIQHSIHRGADLIQQLSSFAREVPYTLRRKKVPEYLEHVLPLLRLHVPKRLVINTEVDAQVSVMLDSNKMDQALANIVANARDAMGGHGNIRITVTRRDPESSLEQKLPPELEWVMLEVADSGPGIPEDLRSRVLEPFFSTKERGKATGLGLSVTNRIVISHHGLIQIGSSPELGGAAIRIYLPIAQELQTNAAS